jgi:hypothetical protein
MMADGDFLLNSLYIPSPLKTRMMMSIDEADFQLKFILIAGRRVKVKLNSHV